jgi:hypothetical protein
LLPLLLLEVGALAAWAALGAAVLGSWPGVACGSVLFVAARLAPTSAWLGWLPAPATTEGGVLELLRAALALLGPYAIGAVAAGRDPSPV